MKSLRWIIVALLLALPVLASGTGSATSFKIGIPPNITGFVDPTSGLTTQTFDFHATFTDVENDTAEFVLLVIGSNTFAMTEDDSNDTNTTDGKNFSVSLKGNQIGLGFVEFFFRASDSIFIVNSEDAV